MFLLRNGWRINFQSLSLEHAFQRHKLDKQTRTKSQGGAEMMFGESNKIQSCIICGC